MNRTILRGRGGARAGAGRKPKLITQLRALALANASSQAEFSLGFCVQVRDSEIASIAERLEAAKILMDRIWGRPRPAAEPIEEKEPLEVTITHFCTNCNHKFLGETQKWSQ